MAKVFKMRVKRRDQIRMALEEIRRKNGGNLTARAVVAAAKNPRHILHKEFEWNDRNAATQAREDKAREIIVQYVSVTIVHKAQRITCPVYVRSPDAEPHEQGYVGLTDADLDEKAAIAIMNRELDQISWAVERARNITGMLDSRFPGVSQQLETLMQGIVGLRGRFAA